MSKLLKWKIAFVVAALSWISGCTSNNEMNSRMNKQLRSQDGSTVSGDSSATYQQQKWPYEHN
jgi:hypothetical protein